MLRILCFLFFTILLPAQEWPGSGGPSGNWKITTDSSVPVSWSGSSGSNILWRTVLPETGQSGIAISGSRLFLTVYKSLPDGDKMKSSADIEGRCYDKNGKLLWKCNLPGSKAMKPTCPYGDSTSPTPATDGRHVWFYNSSGSLGCWTVEGKKVWLNKWTPRPIDPYTRQYQPIICGSKIYQILPEKEKRQGEKKYWCFLHAVDKMTGKLLWKAEDAITVHNTPTLDKVEGKPVILIGRGGPHNAPEKPYGISMLDAETGKRIWQFKKEKSFATMNQVSNDKYTICLEGATYSKGPKDFPGYIHVLNKNDGTVAKSVPLKQTVTFYEYDEETKKHIPRQKEVRINMIRFTGVLNGNDYWFVDSSSSVCKLNLETGTFELIEVPIHKSASGSLIWKKWSGKNDMLNSRGILAAGDKRSHLSGWAKGNTRFWAPPTVINDKIFINAMTGLTYVFKTDCKNLDGNALISVNDSGAPGKTWSGSPISYSDGKIYHRTMKELLCISRKE